jgi:hypothetical protein
MDAGYANTVANSSVYKLSTRQVSAVLWRVGVTLHAHKVIAFEHDWSLHDGVDESSDMGTQRDDECLYHGAVYCVHRTVSHEQRVCSCTISPITHRHVTCARALACALSGI